MKFLSVEKLSPHRYKTPEGYLICTDAIIARTGKQQYKKNELFEDSDDETTIDVDRPSNEVFSEETIASGENKPLCDEHPEEDVNIENHRELSMGYMRDLHKGIDNGKEVLMANIIVTDPDVINEIESGDKTELSCGYDCQILKDAQGNYYQSKIRINHLALCERGRAGNARIQDSALNDSIKENTSYNNGKLKVLTKKEIDRITNEDIYYVEWNGNKQVLSEKGIEMIIKHNNLVQDSVNDVNPKEGEIKEEFLQRFMKETKSEYPDEKQRFAVANSYWERKNEDAINDEENVDKLINEEHEAVESYEEAINASNSFKNRQVYKHIQEEEKEHIEELETLVQDNSFKRNKKQAVKDAYYGTNDNILTKEDAINELKTAKIVHEDYWDAGQPKVGYYVQIQAPGQNTHEDILKYPRVSPKESSYAWGRIWNNDKFLKEFKGALNVVRQDMIRFLQSTHDSVKDSVNLKELENELDNLSCVAWCYTQGDKIVIDSSWKSTQRQTEKDRMDLMQYLNKKVGKDNYDLRYEKLQWRDNNSQCSIRFSLKLKDSVDDSVKDGKFKYFKIPSGTTINFNNMSWYGQNLPLLEGEKPYTFKKDMIFYKRTEMENYVKSELDKKYNAHPRTKWFTTGGDLRQYVVKDEIKDDKPQNKPIKVRIKFESNKEANDALKMLHKKNDFLNSDLIFDDTIEVKTTDLLFDDLKKSLKLFYVDNIKIIDSISKIEKIHKIFNIFKKVKDDKKKIMTKVENGEVHYEGYIDGKFICSGDTKNEVDKELDNVLLNNKKIQSRFVVYAEGTWKNHTALFYRKKGAAQYTTEANADKFTEAEADKIVNYTKGKHKWKKREV